MGLATFLGSIYFRHLMFHGGKGNHICGDKIDLIAEKSVILGQNFQLQSALIPEFPTRLQVSPAWACAPRRVLSEYTSHTLGSFLEYDLTPWTKFQGVSAAGTKTKTLIALQINHPSIPLSNDYVMSSIQILKTETNLMLPYFQQFVYFSLYALASLRYHPLIYLSFENYSKNPVLSNKITILTHMYQAN